VSAFVDHKHSISRTLGFLAAIGSLVWLVLCIQWFRGTRNVPLLRDFRKSDRMNRNPALSVILAARNEEPSVKESVVSMLDQDYSGMLEVIAVNDRSTDRTGEVLDELVRRHPGRLRVLNVESLPEGWLGKTHALYIGAAEATGEWLLFTDADVIFSNHSRQRGNRVAGDKIFTEGLERQRDLIRERTGPPQPPTIPNPMRGSATTHTANVIAAHTPMDLTSFEHNRVSVQKGSGCSGERMMSWVLFLFSISV
jgi:hypothetical protein